MAGRMGSAGQRNPTLIIFKKYSLEIKEDAGRFHWLITLTKTLELMIVGEQMTYQAAFDEAEGRILAMQSDDAADELLHQAAGA